MSITSESASILQSLTGHVSDITSCDFAPNFTIITGSSDKTVRLWEWTVGTGYSEKSFSPLRGHKYGVTCVRVSPQGSMLATSSIDGTAVLWNLHSGTKIYTMVQVNGDAIRVCRFAPDSTVLVTAGDNGAICIWDLVHRNLVRTIFQHEGTTQGLSFTPDSQYLISGCSLELIHVWNLNNLVDTTNDEPCSPMFSADNAHDLGILSLDVSNIITPDEDDPFTKHYSLAVSGNCEDIRIWTITVTMVPKHRNESDVVTLSLTGCLSGHNSAVTCVKYNNSGSNLLSSSLDKLVKVWDLNGACLFTLEGHTRYVNCVAFSRDFSLICSGSNDKSVIVWDLTNSFTPDTELVKQTVAPSDNGISEENMMNSDAQDNTVELIEKVEDIFEGAINSVCFHKNSMVATGSSDKLVRLFNITEESTLEEVTNSPIDNHSYSVNHVEFSKDGTKLATCSLDGWCYVWDPSTGDQIQAIPENKLGIRECRFSPDGSLLVTAGDDETATVWDISTMEAVGIFEGHSDAIASIDFSPDGKIVITACHNGDFRLWTLSGSIYTQIVAHDLGVQSCDFSENLEPIPNVDILDYQNYLLATSGNDSLVKLWIINMPKTEDEGLDYENVQVRIWRRLQGHGGTVFCVRFSKGASELVCSTATDRQARIWSVYSADCLHVLDHDSIVTSCSFSENCSMLVSGCFDKTLWVWKLPQQLVFQTAVANKLNKTRTKILPDWLPADVAKWLHDVNLEDLEEAVINSELDGEKILTNSEEEICMGLDLDEETTEKFSNELKWLKQDEHYFNFNYWNKITEIPDEFVCPITQEIMREPVTVSDGFTYEKRAITEWFMSGKFTSPMTNMTLENTDYVPNQDLRNAIHNFLYKDEED